MRLNTCTKTYGIKRKQIARVENKFKACVPGRENALEWKEFPQERAEGGIP